MDNPLSINDKLTISPTNKGMTKSIRKNNDSSPFWNAAEDRSPSDIRNTGRGQGRSNSAEASRGLTWLLLPSRDH